MKKSQALTNDTPAASDPLAPTQAQAVVTRKVFKMSATIPTGSYENLSPSVEIEYAIPDGATPPDNIQVLIDLMQDLGHMIYPIAFGQTKALPIDAAMKSPNPQVAISKVYMASPVFKWLATTNREIALSLVQDRAHMHSVKYNPQFENDADEDSEIIDKP